MKVQELFERVKNSGEEVTITMRTTGDAKQRLAELLHHVSRYCAMGASRAWGPFDDDDTPKIYFDGDGADHMHDIKINGEHLKNFIKDAK